MTLPKISIVTPSFNQGAFIEQTIQSVLAQDYPNLEYVIIDGGSTDNTVDIIKKHESKLHYWISEKDKGHGDALNKGFSHTSGEIMAWLNSDDQYTPWSFRVVAEIFTQFPHVAWISGTSSLWNKDGAMIHAWSSAKNVHDFLLGNYAWVQQESTFWRRGLWEKAGAYINEDYRLMVDGELWTRFFLNEQLYSIDCILGGYRLHPANRAKLHYQACLEEMERAVDEMRHQCSKEVLADISRLRLLNRLRQIPILSRLRSFNLVRRLFFHGALTRAQYRNIRWKDEQWLERTLPFSLDWK